MNQLDYDYTVRIDLPIFRSIVKTAKELGADRLEFKVYKKKDDSGIIMFCLRSEGTSSTKHYFPSSAGEGGVFSASSVNADVDDLEDPTQWQQTYCDSFGLNSLGLFLRSMYRQIVTLRMGVDATSQQGLPLLTLFPLGGDSSNVCYILAPKTEDD